MNTEGQVGVELRLVMDQLRKDVKQAAEMLRTSLGTGAEGAASSTDKATRKMSELEQQTRKTTRAMEEQKRQLASMNDEWRKNMGVPNVPRILDASIPSSKGLFAGQGAILNKGVPSYMPPSLTSMLNPPQATSGGSSSGGGWGSRPPPGFTGIGAPPVGIFSSGGAGGAGGGGGAALGGLFGGGGMLPILAQVGAALAGLRVAIGLVKYAFDMLLSPLRAVTAAATAASRGYAQAQVSGRPLDYSIGASAVGSVLGVSADDILMFGQSLQMVSEKLKFSVAILQETNQTLTPLGWNLKSLGVSFNALFSAIGAQLAPALNQTINLMRNLVDTLSMSALGKVAGFLIKVVIHIANILMGLPVLMLQTFELITQAFVDGLQYFIRQVRNSIARTFGGTIDSGDKFAETKSKWELMGRTITDLFGRGANTQTAPGPQGNANRMASSAWERMGLIVGPGPAADAGRETARNTRRMVWLLEQIVGANGSGAPRGGYGSNPLTSAA